MWVYTDLQGTVQPAWSYCLMIQPDSCWSCRFQSYQEPPVHQPVLIVFMFYEYLTKIKINNFFDTIFYEVKPPKLKWFFFLFFFSTAQKNHLLKVSYFLNRISFLFFCSSAPKITNIWSTFFIYWFLFCFSKFSAVLREKWPKLEENYILERFFPFFVVLRKIITNIWNKIRGNPIGPMFHCI